jgi:hypothetical protein
MKTRTRESLSTETLCILAGITTAMTTAYFFAASLFA